MQHALVGWVDVALALEAPGAENAGGRIAGVFATSACPRIPFPGSPSLACFFRSLEISSITCSQSPFHSVLFRPTVSPPLIVSSHTPLSLVPRLFFWRCLCATLCSPRFDVPFDVPFHVPFCVPSLTAPDTLFFVTAKTLRLTGAKRMIVGHTPQRAGINSAADGQVWRVDTGMTAMIGGRPEV